MMNTIKMISGVVAATVMLAGCQTLGQASALSQGYSKGGAASVSCAQIQSAFAAYDADRSSAQTMIDLSKMINVDAGALAGGAAQTSDEYYAQVKSATDIALSVKGCAPSTGSAQ